MWSCIHFWMIKSLWMRHYHNKYLRIVYCLIVYSIVGWAHSWHTSEHIAISYCSLSPTVQNDVQFTIIDYNKKHQIFIFKSYLIIFVVKKILKQLIGYHNNCWLIFCRSTSQIITQSIVLGLHKTTNCNVAHLQQLCHFYNLFRLVILHVPLNSYL